VLAHLISVNDDDADSERSSIRQRAGIDARFAGLALACARLEALQKTGDDVAPRGHAIKPVGAQALFGNMVTGRVHAEYRRAGAAEIDGSQLRTSQKLLLGRWMMGEIDFVADD
jgi:hypothetical protein